MSAMYQTFQNTPIFQTAWRGFLGSKWTDEVNVRDFIQNNYTQYDGDESFLAAPTSATHLLWERLQKLQKEEHEKGGVLECETEIVSSLTAYGPGYIDPELKDLERIVGLQTDKPLKRAFMPFGGIKMAEEAAETYGYHVNPKFHKIFTEYHKTHNQAVFDAYTPEMKTARHCHIVTGLPDTYGRGRIVGDYRRIALYGIDFLIQEKKKDLERCGNGAMFDDIIRQREEIAEQIRALKGIQEMAAIYGFDISRPASNAKEAVQWLYFGYLAAVKTQNGAAMSVGRVSTFLDIYINRDLTEQTLTESRGTGINRPYDNEIPHGKICPDPILQPTFLRRSGLGDAGGCRSGTRRASDGNEKRFPLFTYAGKYGTIPGTKPDRPLLFPPARGI